MADLYQWARDHNISALAVTDLIQRMGCTAEVNDNTTSATTEAGASQRKRLEAARRGDMLWRNNVGQFFTETGARVRCGLANESKGMNTHIKSSDLIGITQVVVTPEMVGTTVGIFTAVEMKKPGWIFTGVGRETPQLTFIELVIAKGGIGYFSTGGER